MSILPCRLRSGLRAALPIVLTLFPALLAHADDRTMVFRFRPGSEAAAWTNNVVYEGGATPGTASTPLDIPTLNPLNQDFAKVDLDGVNDHVRATAAITVRRTAYDLPGATIQVWFRPDRLSGKQTLISNLTSGGFSVHLDGNRLAGTVRFGGRNVSVIGERPLQVGKWYVATLIVSEINFGSRYAVLSLLLDGERDGFTSSVLEPQEGLRDSSVPLVLGAQPAPLSQFLKGRMHAATVRNYVMNGTYAQARVLNDGGELMGAASFDDGVPYGASGQDAWMPPDLAVDWSPEEGNGVSARAFVPFTSDDYVVQGVAHSCEGGQTCTRNLLYLSQYWHSVSDLTASAGVFPQNRSLITEVDLDQMRITRCWRISGGAQAYGHVGGMGYFNGSVYVASDNVINRYTVGSAPDAPMGPGENCGELRVATYESGNPMSWRVLTSGYMSFANVNGERTILVGSNGGGLGPYVWRYKLYSHGTLMSAGDPFGLHIPFAKYWVPYSAQGVEMVVEGGQEYLVVSAAKGLYKYRAADAVGGKPANSKILYFPTTRIPRGIEDLARVGSTYWSASESGARYYQRRPFGGDIEPWSKFYPFIFTFDPAQMQGQVPTDADFSDAP